MMTNTALVVYGFYKNVEFFLELQTPSPRQYVILYIYTYGYV